MIAFDADEQDPMLRTQAKMFKQLEKQSIELDRIKEKLLKMETANIRLEDEIRQLRENTQVGKASEV